MTYQVPVTEATRERHVDGEFLTIDSERYYAIRNIDRMKAFFISVVSSSDHWLFVSSTGGLTAGRCSPETALFPYVPVDKIHESAPHTGCQTLVRIDSGHEFRVWEPYNLQHFGRYEISRNLYKNVLGNKLCFEEVNHDLELCFRYTWQTSEEYGFVRHCELVNLGPTARDIEVLDGLQNVLPAGTPRQSQTNASNLVDAYKWTELDEKTGLALFTLFSAVSDRAAPCESLRANIVYSLGLDAPTILLSNRQINRFRGGSSVQPEQHRRGIRGAYYVSAAFELQGDSAADWTLVADIEKSQAEVIELQSELGDKTALENRIAESIVNGTRQLAATVAAADGFQSVREEEVSVHHYANVLFNVLRGGIFDHNYAVPAADFRKTIERFNPAVYGRNRELLEKLPASLSQRDLLAAIQESGDPQLERLCLEYLPIRFGRRHGDPSRPWNHFAIRLKDKDGADMLAYEGNWRDIFQNWEALLFSYPDFIESVIAKFVNASTADGYNPYRITKDGIDWEVEDESDPWSYIGYWGDHQIIYLQKLLELSRQFHPRRLGDLLHSALFSYANVPYRIRDFDAIWQSPKDTVSFDAELASRIEEDIRSFGADAKLIRGDDGEVLQVTLLEKLLVTLLAKIGNTVIGGGIWLNTQRPEWNDANNALVGHGLSMVTLYYLRRYMIFLRELLDGDGRDATLSAGVADWLIETAENLAAQQALTTADEVSDEERFAALQALGATACRYRSRLYQQKIGTLNKTVPTADIIAMLDDALSVAEYSIRENRRADGMYHAYNLMAPGNNALGIERLYPMLEGQVAVLSSGTLGAGEACDVIEALFASEVYRPDQRSFMLYPDRKLPRFLEKNVIPAEAIDAIPLLGAMHAKGDSRLLVHDPAGRFRFHADCVNSEALEERLSSLHHDYGDAVDADRAAVAALYEDVFDHRSFTGRSGGMFGFEGLGCVYWHMVSKLLLAVQENFFYAASAGDENAAKLAELYYRIRDGLGFNKTPEEYGAFPTDPYSHSTGHSGARQPGMTGQVKEEIITRFGELGVRVSDGLAEFSPRLLRRREFCSGGRDFEYLAVDGSWQKMAAPANSIVFTWCQVPICYVLGNTESFIELVDADGGKTRLDGLSLTREQLASLCSRSGAIRQLTVSVPDSILFSD